MVATVSWFKYRPVRAYTQRRRGPLTTAAAEPRRLRRHMRWGKLAPVRVPEVKERAVRHTTRARPAATRTLRRAPGGTVVLSAHPDDEGDTRFAGVVSTAGT